MKTVIWRKKAGLAAMLLGCALALARCEDGPLAGSSVTTGNPTEIQVSFKGENGDVALSGRVEVYGSTQVPIPGFRPEPLASIEVSGEKDVILNPGHFASIADSMWPEGSLEGDTLAHFNLVVTGEGQGAIVRDLAFKTRKKVFQVGGLSLLSARRTDKATVEAGLVAMTEFRAYIDPGAMMKSRLDYLFLKGTGFSAEGDKGAFLFPSLPQGDHRVSFISVPDPKSGGATGEDSASIYSLDQPLSSDGADTLKVTDLDFQLLLPDQFKH